MKCRMMKCYVSVLFLWMFPRAVAQPRIGAVVSIPFRTGLFIYVAAATHIFRQNGSTGKLSRFVDNKQCLFCLIQAVPVDFETPLSSGGFHFECLPKANGEDADIFSEIPFQINLPQDFVEEHIMHLQSGLSTLCVPGGRPIRFPNSTLPGQVVVPEGADIELIRGGQAPGEGGGRGFGNRTVLVVRVSGTSESPVETLEEMRGAVFGLGRQALANSMKAQYGRCSFSKINFVPALGFDQFENGALNIQLNYRLQGKEALGVMNDALEAATEVLGVGSLGGSFEHVIFCIARGTFYSKGGFEWKAFALLNSWRSVFNSGQCNSLSYLMHEIGHNLGLVHSGDDVFLADSYGDTTGMMGFSESTVNGPLKCFNPSKNWHLGWYRDKALEIGLGESWTGRLVAFVDYELADPSMNEFVLLRLNDFLFVQYNRAKAFNAGTSLHRDKVVVVIGVGGQSSSWSVLRVGLGPRTSNSWKGMTIQVCALRFDAFSGMDYAEVSVHPIGSTSSCTFAPTLSPSLGTGPTSQLPSLSPMATPAPLTERPSREAVSVGPTITGAPTSFLDQCDVGGQFYNVTAPTYRLNTTVPEGSWDGDVSMHGPSNLIYTADGYLLVFGSGRGFCGQLGITSKYMEPGTSSWKPGSQFFGGCDLLAQPDWIPGPPGTALADFESPAVLYRSTPTFPNARYSSSRDQLDLRRWVMYYSIKINTDDVEESKRFDLSQACIGRATATGTPDNLVWIDDGRPVYCSNVNYDERGYPVSKRFDTSSEYLSNAGERFAMDPAIMEDEESGEMYLAWGRGVVISARIDPLTGHLESAAQSTRCGGPCKEHPFEEFSNAHAYPVLSVGSRLSNEAPYAFEYKADDGTRYHYLFVNWHDCCLGVCSTSEIRVGRSVDGPQGLYVDKAGLRLDERFQQTVVGVEDNGGGTLLLGSMGRYRGPGYVGVLKYNSLSTGETKRVITFHFYDLEEEGLPKLAGRELLIDRSGWPVVSSVSWDVCDLMGCNELAPVSGVLPLLPTPSAPSPLPTPALKPNSTPPPTLLPTPAPTPNPTREPAPFPTVAPTPNPIPFPSSFTVTPAPIPPVHVAQWVQVGDDIDGENPGDQSGYSVALSSNGAVLAIGAGGNDGGGRNAGHVRVYINVGGGWELRGGDLEGSAAGDDFGYSVALSADGTILAVGARVANGVNGVDSGRVHLYHWMFNTWQPLGSTLDGAGAGDWFGYSLALSDDGTILAVGASQADDSEAAGYARIFAWTVTDWNQRGNDLLGSSSGDQFGDSIALSSDGAIVACGADQGGPGYVRIYRWSGTEWQQQGSTLVGLASNDDFGESVSLSGDGSIVAVGADAGNYAVVYRNDATDWVRIGQTICGECSSDSFGVSLSLSFDGKTVVIGGSANNSNGIDSGHALVFRLSPNGQEWMQVGQELVGEAADDRFGHSTSISDDGTRIAIGAIRNDGNGDGAGHVRVYDLQ